MNMMKLMCAFVELAIIIFCGIGAYLTIANYLVENNPPDLFGGIGFALAMCIGILFFIGILKED